MRGTNTYPSLARGSKIWLQNGQAAASCGTGFWEVIRPAGTVCMGISSSGSGNDPDTPARQSGFVQSRLVEAATQDSSCGPYLGLAKAIPTTATFRAPKLSMTFRTFRTANGGGLNGVAGAS